MLATLAALAGLSAPAHAVDGCKVLLCLAAPRWRSIPLCVPPVRQALHDLARGKPFPSCAMSGSGTSSNNSWSHAPDHCPPQYTQVTEGENGPIYTCDYTGAVSISVNGALFTRTWWDLNGDAVTEFTPAAKDQLGEWDTRFDDDYAAWRATQPPSPPVNPN
jgi:hypothetical protein